MMAVETSIACSVELLGIGGNTEVAEDGPAVEASAIDCLAVDEYSPDVSKERLLSKDDEPAPEDVH